MSITGIWAAANVGIEAGQAVSGFLFNYTKSEYENKITIVETLLAELQGHLADMKALQDEIHKFWDDDKARRTYTELMTTINHTEKQMTTVKPYLVTLRTIVNELDSADTQMQQTLEDIQHVLNLGIQI